MKQILSLLLIFCMFSCIYSHHKFAKAKKLKNGNNFVYKVPDIDLEWCYVSCDPSGKVTSSTIKNTPPLEDDLDGRDINVEITDGVPEALVTDIEMDTIEADDASAGDDDGGGDGGDGGD